MIINENPGHFYMNINSQTKEWKAIRTSKQGNGLSIPSIKELHASWGSKVILKQRRGSVNLVKQANWQSKIENGF